MTDARSEILARLGNVPAAVDGARSIQPPDPESGAPRPVDERIRRFVACAESAAATWEIVENREIVASHVADYLRRENLGTKVWMTGDLPPLEHGSLEPTQWDPSAEVASIATGDGITMVAPCSAAVAETGTLVVTSDTSSDARLHYLAENVILVLAEIDVLETYEDVWSRFEGSVPRLVSFVTGPSRTADIEQTIERGAHGPRRMHILVCREKP